MATVITIPGIKLLEEKNGAAMGIPILEMKNITKEFPGVKAWMTLASV